MEWLIPIVAIFCVFGLPMIIVLVSMLLKHQRNMAALIHQNRGVNQEQESEIARLKSEVETLKAALYEHSTSVDDNVRALSSRIDRIESATQTRNN
ncbi:MAG: hypothetical protein KIT74_03125 [Fimbriimonadales bacterium]|nr:hypothetical protein [Fimbriimonadales bacterium]